MDFQDDVPREKHLHAPAAPAATLAWGVLLAGVPNSCGLARLVLGHRLLSGFRPRTVQLTSRFRKTFYLFQAARKRYTRPTAGAVSETVTTKDICEAAGISAVTAHRWAKEGVLPTPTNAFLGRRGTVAQWPAHAVEQAQWVRGRLDARQSFSQIRAALERGEFQPGKPEENK